MKRKLLDSEKIEDCIGFIIIYFLFFRKDELLDTWSVVLLKSSTNII